MVQECPIWGTAAQFDPTTDDNVSLTSSRTGGKYFVSGTAKTLLENCQDPLVRARLTTWLIDQRSLGVQCPKILDTEINKAKQQPPLPIHERADRLLKYLATKSPHIGTEVIYENSTTDLHMEMLAWSESIAKDELLFLIEYLIQQGWITEENKTKDSASYIVTVNGYARLAELETKAIDSKQGFVAMWFNATMNVAYENAIEEAIRISGYTPFRIDRKDHNNKIDDEVVAEIRRSRFVVADFTHGKDGMRGGVYYEAGLAHGLNIPVIFTCRQDLLDENKIHFDTRQYNHIGWTENNLEEFKDALAKRISATIGDGPNKKKE